MRQLQHLQSSCQAVAACIAAEVTSSEAAYKQLFCAWLLVLPAQCRLQDDENHCMQALSQSCCLWKDVKLCSVPP